MSSDRRNRRAVPTFTTGSQRSVFGYWVPLIVTVTAATIAIGAWVWSERRDSDEGEFGESEDAAYARKLREQRRQVSKGQDDEEFFEVGPGGVLIDEHGRQIDLAEREEHGVASNAGAQGETFFGRFNDVIRRTPSPQQLYDGASKRVAAGVAAVGKSLRSIQEEGRDDFVDHERWSEEAESKAHETDTRASAALVEASASAPQATARSTTASTSSGRKRLVAVVVSAENAHSISQVVDDDTYHIEHASILSHLINHVNPDTVDLLVLIYAPHLTSHPLSRDRRPSSSHDSSYSNISGREAGREDDDRVRENAQQSMYHSLSTQAAALTSHPTHVMPFTSPTGHVAILRHIAPSMVYIQESLCGSVGENVKHIEGWVGQVVVVVGADIGAGLVDSTDDESVTKEKSQWWRNASNVGLGKGVEICDGERVGDDWTKRIGS